MKERTLIIIKPDGISKEKEIISRYQKAGLKVVAKKEMKATKELLRQHYSAHAGKPFYEGLVEFMSSRKVAAFVLEGKNAVEVARKVTGATDPSKADKGTIRGDLGTDIQEKANREKRAIQNLVHASGTRDEAEKEIRLWFPEM